MDAAVVTTSPQDAAMGALPASPHSMRCALASLQARQPGGPLRSVTLAGCASGGSRSSATVEFWVRRLRLKKWRGVKVNRHALAFGKRAHKRRNAMDACAMCKRNVLQAENWIKCHFCGGLAIFHWRCFGEYLRAESEQRVERVVWEACRIG